MKILGIIGPYFSGGSRVLIDHNIANAQFVMIEIANYFAHNKLVGFFCPHSHTARFERLAEAPESYYHALDDAMYQRACDGFILLPGWTVSSGAIRDHKNAVASGKKIFCLMDYSVLRIEEMLKEISKWAYRLANDS